MRQIVCAVLVSLAAGVTGAETLWVGGTAGWSWDWKPATRVSDNFANNQRVGAGLALGLPIDSDTTVRFQIADLPHDLGTPGGTVARGVLRGYTVGVDYGLQGGFGSAFVAGGLGAYDARVDAPYNTGDYARMKFGWYVGIGEWFPVTKHVRGVIELDVHKTQHSDRPTIFSAVTGLAYSF
ncbi:MAG: hypothetical protein GW878_01170 [Acidobacteria bacterium]|nr:hypothetical protein [Acidobacteriota bacterium]